MEHGSAGLLTWAPPQRTKDKTTKDCSLPSSSIHGIFQARVLEWVAISFSKGIFPTQGLNLGLLHHRQILCHLSHQRSPILTYRD